MRKPSKETIIKAWIKTSYCYCQALKEYYPELLKDFTDEQMKKYRCDQEMREVLSLAGEPDRSEDIHRLYMKFILELPTKDLEQIISYNENKYIKRAAGTIDEISYELLDRAVKNSETKE